MKRALIVATVGGFLSQFEMNNVKVLQERGYEVHYASNFNNGMYHIDYDKLHDKKVVLHHVEFSKNPIKVKDHWEVLKQLKKIIEEYEIDILHCHTPVGGVLARVAAFCVRKDIYVIYTAHGFHFYHGAPLKNWLYYPVEKILARITDCLITVNKEDFCQAQKFLHKKNGYATQIPGVGLDLERFQMRLEQREIVRQELGLLDSSFHLVTIGEINRNKNLEVTVKALAELRNPDIVYSIYGRGKSIEYIERLIEECHLEKQVKYCGYCTDPERVLQSADLFLFPSIREGLGMAALEALACGVPVIALDNRGTREYMRTGVNGMVCEENTPSEFAQKINQAYVMYKNGNWECITKDGCAESVKRFAIHETEKVMRKVYENAESKNKRTGNIGDYGSVQSKG